MASTRRFYTPAFKKRMVKLCNKLGSVSEAADRDEVAHSVVRKWCRDPELGGEPGAFSYERNGEVPANETAVSLPTVKVGRRRSARPLLATKFVCPHCGGPIKEV